MAKKAKSLQTYGINFYENRDEKTFAILLSRLKPGIASYLVQYVQDKQTREVVIANTFLKVWEKIDQYDPYYAFSTWAYRIARNEALLSKRYSAKNYSFEGMEEAGIHMTSKFPSLVQTPDYEFFEPTPEEEINRLYKMVIDEINNLPGVYRVVLSGQLVKKQKLEEIAEENNINLNTVKTRARKAKVMVKDALEKRDPKLVEKYYVI